MAEKIQMISKQKRLFNKIRKNLPFQFKRLIEAKLDGISVRQISGVFDGEITNPEMVSKVKAAAIKVQDQQRRLHGLKKTRKATVKK